MTDAPPPKRPGMPFSGKRGEPREVRSVLRGVIAPLMRQLRRFEAYHACLAVLVEFFGEDLQGLAAPHEIRLAAGPSADTELHTLFIYAASPTVATVIGQRERQIVERINARLRVAVVEALRCEVVPLAKVQKQLEMLELEPD